MNSKQMVLRLLARSLSNRPKLENSTGYTALGSAFSGMSSRITETSCKPCISGFLMGGTGKSQDVDALDAYFLPVCGLRPEAPILVHHDAVLGVVASLTMTTGVDV